MSATMLMRAIGSYLAAISNAYESRFVSKPRGPECLLTVVRLNHESVYLW